MVIQPKKTTLGARPFLDALQTSWHKRMSQVECKPASSPELECDDNEGIDLLAVSPPRNAPLCRGLLVWARGAGRIVRKGYRRHRYELGLEVISACVQCVGWRMDFGRKAAFPAPNVNTCSYSCNVLEAIRVKDQQR